MSRTNDSEPRFQFRRGQLGIIVCDMGWQQRCPLCGDDFGTVGGAQPYSVNTGELVCWSCSYDRDPIIAELVHIGRAAEEFDGTPDRLSDLLDAVRRFNERRAAAMLQEVEAHRALLERLRPYVRSESDTIGELLKREAAADAEQRQSSIPFAED